MKIGRKIRVLHLIYCLEAGGAERVVVNYAKLFDKKNFDVLVCALTWGGQYEKDLKSNEIKYYILNKREGFDPSIIIKLNRLIRSEKIDIVHFHDFSSGVWGTIPSILSNVKVIVRTEHTISKRSFDRKFDMRLLLKSFMNLFHHKIIAVSEEVKRSHLGSSNFFSGKYTTIYNGIDLRLFDTKFDKSKYLEEFNLQDKTILIGIVARLSPMKAHEIFLQAMKRIIQKRNDVRAIVVGDGPRKLELIDLCDELGLKKNVVFAGFREDIPELMNLVDIATLSSDWEGLPMTILEAMACGKPVVVTDVGGNREAVVDGETGFIVPPRDENALAERMLQLVEDPGLRLEMGGKGKERFIEKFTAEKMVRKTEELYEELINI